MFSWVVDNASTCYLILGCAGLVLLACWWKLRKRELLICLGVMAGLAGLVFLLSLLVETDRKRLRRTLEEMMDGVQQRNLDRTFAHIAPECTTHFSGPAWSRAELRNNAERAIRHGGVKRIHLWDFDYEEVKPPRAVVFFKAKPFGDWALGLEYCGCRATFRLDNGRWVMTKLELFKPEQKELLDPPM